MLRNTAYNAQWLTRPELVEIKVANVQTASRESKRLFDFTMRISIKRPPESNPGAGSVPAVAAGAASAPAAKKSLKVTSMATQAKPANLDLNSVLESATSQFRGLNPNQPGQWPWLPWPPPGRLRRWWSWPDGSWCCPVPTTNSTPERGREPVLKQDYRTKLAQAVNLNELRKQKLQVEET